MAQNKLSAFFRVMKRGIDGTGASHQLVVVFLAVVTAVVFTVLAIYLTPLKHLNLVPPVMNEMDPKTFYEAYTAHPDDYLFIDVRSSGIYDSAHARGAINIPVENLYDDHDLLPRSGKKIALICTTGRLAAIAYGYLEDWGFTNLIHIQGGVQNWVAEGLPLEGLRANDANIVNEMINQPDQHQ